MARMMTHGELRRRRRRRWKMLGYFVLLVLAGAYSVWRIWIGREIDSQIAEPRRLTGPDGVPVRSEPEFGRASGVSTDAPPAEIDVGTLTAAPGAFDPKALTNRSAPVLPKAAR